MRQLAIRLERDDRLDGMAEKLGTWFDGVVKPGPLKDLLSGTWFGHPVHPPLTAGVVGMWSGAALLDTFGGDRTQAGADALVGLGVLAALPTLATGWNELADTDGAPKRLAAVHGLANACLTGVFALSYLSRKAGLRGVGRFLALTGVGLASGTAYLGGHLSFVRGIGVNQTAFEKPRNRWTAVLGEDELAEAKMTRATVDGVEIVLYRRGERVWALSNHCSHRGGPLFRGKVVDGHDDPSVECPWHASTFRFDDGSIEQGPAAVPQPAFEARLQDGKVEVRPKQA